MRKSYGIKRCSGANTIDANWEKPFWREIEPAKIILSHWTVQSEHIPKTEVKLQYDDKNLYVIFRVQDQYVRAVTTQIHGDVWKDSCVEFFFAPSKERPSSYFHLETNCCGVLLMQHHTRPHENSCYLDVQDCQKIIITSSASGPIRNEIAKPLVWTLEYALPVKILSKYSDMQKPAPGVVWRGNFYKCADDSSHPHWMTWSKIDTDFPDFHRPEFFGLLEFE
ncbi:MAG: carbohydrate-binding family 9-like protein [Anaerohalosphaeraceae bacterium]